MAEPRISRADYDAAVDFLYCYDGNGEMPGGVIGEGGDGYIHSVGLAAYRTAGSFVEELYFSRTWYDFGIRHESPEAFVAMMERAAEVVPGISGIVSELRPAMEAGCLARGIGMTDYSYFE